MWPSSAKGNCRALATSAKGGGVRIARAPGALLEVLSAHAKYPPTRKLARKTRARAEPLHRALRRWRGVQSRQQQHARDADRSVERARWPHEHHASRDGAQGAARAIGTSSADHPRRTRAAGEHHAADDETGPPASTPRRHRRGLRRAASAAATAAEACRAAGATAAVRAPRRSPRRERRRAMRAASARAPRCIRRTT